ncbi:MAG: ribosomal RNA small subunit methyltransferase A [Planctomycetes bacterium]|nr:ribosomal RNA small subunit methyltransferase A [Planctomycetota bacterium]
MNLLKGPHTKTLLKTIFSQRGIRPRKRLGQNFLIDQNILRFIVNASSVGADDIILEVGTGTGALTSLLAEKAQMVFSVEMDTGLFKLASEALQSYSNIRLINKDILSSKSALEPQVENELLSYIRSLQRKLILKVVSNLPYSISTPLIIKLLEGPLPIELMVLTLQRDIVNRLVAQPGTKDYGILSITAQLFSDINLIKTLSPEVFWPTPKIESAVVVLHVHKEKLKNISNYELFQKIVHAIFESRRKIIVNSFVRLSESASGVTRFKPLLIPKEQLLTILRGLGIAPDQRGETLTPEQFAHLSEEINLFLTGSGICF